jgi:hypothetical protein
MLSYGTIFKKISGFILPFLFSFCLQAQNNTFSPYSRYGVGELSQPTFAHNTGMGGAHIALRPDSTMPIFINPGNPASYPLIRLTTLEVGGRYQYSQFSSGSAQLNQWGTYFSYGALGFPIRHNGGACFGVMPYSSVGYDTQSTAAESIGNVNYQYNGNGGLTKAFLGYGVSPFSRLNLRFRNRLAHKPDSLRPSASAIRFRHGFTKFVSDLSLGANANYIFGTISNNTRVVYPNSLLYNNTYRENSFTLGDFTGNAGLQGAIGIDSVKRNGTRRALQEKVKITFGVYLSLSNPLKISYNSTAYNYMLNGSGQELIRDTVIYSVNNRSAFRLPVEQGFGLGFKKGERFNLVTDLAITNWQKFKLLNEDFKLKDNYRISAGFNFVPEKYAAGRGAFFRRLHYRFGVSHETGYIMIRNKLISNSYVSAGIGIPVGIARLSSMVNVSAQYGQMGLTSDNLLKENYWRINFGFTFCDRWFQKFRYD